MSPFGAPEGEPPLVVRIGADGDGNPCPIYQERPSLQYPWRTHPAMKSFGLGFLEKADPEISLGLPVALKLNFGWSSRIQFTHELKMRCCPAVAPSQVASLSSPPTCGAPHGVFWLPSPSARSGKVGPLEKKTPGDSFPTAGSGGHLSESRFVGGNAVTKQEAGELGLSRSSPYSRGEFPMFNHSLQHPAVCPGFPKAFKKE